MTKMCSAMRELAAGKFRPSCCPASGARTNSAEMAGAVGGVQGGRPWRAPNATPATQGKRRTRPQARRRARRAHSFCRRFRDRGRRHRRQRFRRLPWQLEAAAGTLTRTAENHPEPVEPGLPAPRKKPPATCSRWRRRPRSCRLPSTRLAAASRNPGQIAEAAGASGRNRPTAASANCRAAAQEIGDVVKLITAIADADQSLGIECHHRSGPRPADAGRGFAVVRV